jgi:hypothetical protein
MLQQPQAPTLRRSRNLMGDTNSSAAALQHYGWNANTLATHGQLMLDMLSPGRHGNVLPGTIDVERPRPVQQLSPTPTPQVQHAAQSITQQIQRAAQTGVPNTAQQSILSRVLAGTGTVAPAVGPNPPAPTPATPALGVPTPAATSTNFGTTPPAGWNTSGWNAQQRLNNQKNTLDQVFNKAGISGLVA